MTKTRTIAALNVLFLLTLPVSARAQESLQAAKDLYASAAYEDSLGMLSRLQRADAPAEVQQYRAFCLIALGRLPEAEKAIESVVKANPEFVPAALEVSPRIQEIFTRTRNQLLPDLVRDMYLVAKQALERKDRTEAVAGFKAVVELIDGAGADGREALDEMRFLAAGFLDLSRAIPEPGVNRPPTVAAPVQSASAPASSGSLPPAATPANTPPLEITPPVAIRQTMPPWTPTDNASRRTTYSGAIRVGISVTGQVERAEIVRSVHPMYDRLLLQAAKNWAYQPARRSGSAVPSEQVVEVQLKPNQ